MKLTSNQVHEIAKELEAGMKVFINQFVHPKSLGRGLYGTSLPL